MQQISIFDARIRGNYNQGSQFFKLTNFFENSSDLETELRRRDIAPTKPTFCSLPYFKSEKNNVIAACYVLDKNGQDKLITLKASDLAIKDLNRKYNVPIFWRDDAIIYPIFSFLDANLTSKPKQFIEEDKCDLEFPIDEFDLLSISVEELKLRPDILYKIRKNLKEEGDIIVLDKYQNALKKSQPIFLKYFHLLIYAYENLPFFFVAVAPEFSLSTKDKKWQIYSINYDGAKIQQIVEMHGYIFLFLKEKTVVYTLSVQQNDNNFPDITEASGQNLPIGTDNAFSVIKHLNKIITLYNSSIYTIAQFQPTKISIPTVDAWLAKSRKERSSIALMTLKEGSFDFLYAVNTDKNEAWIMNLHNETWSHCNLNGIAYKEVAYSANHNTKYINILGQLCSYQNSLSEKSEYTIETGLISLDNKVHSVSEMVISFDSLPQSKLQLTAEYKLLGCENWHEATSESEIEYSKLKSGNVLHRRLKIRSSQFALKLTFKSLEESAKPLIIQDVVLYVS